MPTMLPNLVGVRVVTETKVLRDWALHFGPSDGGSLAKFFGDIASGANDSGDGFLLGEGFDVVRVQARVSDQKGGQEMTIPTSAGFQDATAFGQWFTFQVPQAGDWSGGHKGKERDRGSAHKRTPSWRATMAGPPAGITGGLSNSGLPATISPARALPEDMALEDTSGAVPTVSVPALGLNMSGKSSAHNTYTNEKYEESPVDDDEDGSSDDGSDSSSAASELECNTHKTTNLDEEEEKSDDSSVAVDSSHDALSSVHESFMQLMHKLLRAMPSTPQSARLLQCANPPYTPSGRSRGCNGDHKHLSGPCPSCNPDDAGAWTYNISQLVFDYITTVMFDEGIMLDVDYNAWEGVLLVVENNPTACKVALSKLGENPQTAGKCLMTETAGPCKDFAYLFCKAVIRHSHVTHRLVMKDVETSPVYNLGNGLLTMFEDSDDSTSCDVVPLFDVVCSCVLVTLQLGYKLLWRRAVLALGKVSSKLAESAWGGNAVQVLKLETINKIFARLVREGLIHDKATNGAPYNLPADLQEDFAQHKHLAQGFVHPLMLVKDEFVEFVQAYMWDCDTTTFQVLVALEELLSDENSFSGHDFSKVSRSIHSIVGINDRFLTHRMVYWLFRPEEKKSGIWHLAFGRFGRQHRWRLLHLLMKLSDCGEETMENFRNMPNWGRLIGWMLKDGAAEGGKVAGDPSIDKGVILEWARCFEPDKEGEKKSGHSTQGSSGRMVGSRHSRKPSTDHVAAS